MTLYNIKTDGDEYRITKFTNDLDVESSYLTSHTECQCPAGSRPTCRHRQMLPTMLAADLLDTGGFYDFESRQVLFPIGNESEPMFEKIETETDLQVHDIVTGRATGNRPTFTEGEVGITAEELAAEIPTYEEAIAEDKTLHGAPISNEALNTLYPNHEQPDPQDKPHPHLPKVDRRI